MAADGTTLEDLTAKLGGGSGVAIADAVACVAADLDRRAITPEVWREMSAHELLDLIDVPRAGSFLPYSLSERLTACTRRIGGTPVRAQESPGAEPVAATPVLEQAAAAEVLSAIQSELAALRQLIEALGAELRERLEAVHEEVLTATGVLDPGPTGQRVAEPETTPHAQRRARAAWVVLLVVAGIAVVAGVLLALYGWDELRGEVSDVLADWL